MRECIYLFFLGYDLDKRISGITSFPHRHTHRFHPYISTGSDMIAQYQPTCLGILICYAVFYET